MSEDSVICGGCFVDAWNHFARNDQDVSGRGGADVAKGDHEIIFINDVSGDFAIGDFLKQRLAHGATLQNRALHDNEIAVVGLLGGEALAEVFDDWVAQGLAAGTPALTAGDLFDATAQTMKAHYAGRGLEVVAEFVAQALEKEEFAAFADGSGEFGKVRDGEFGK